MEKMYLLWAEIVALTGEKLKLQEQAFQESM